MNMNNPTMNNFIYTYKKIQRKNQKSNEKTKKKTQEHKIRISEFVKTEAERKHFQRRIISFFCLYKTR